ncbi:decaprenyl-phosphate phosphoribosyltransferase [Rathayibacter iranicus]|uniref:Decaprenyl-phosphate phosphoribosyltransferase n=2 Tax=Rathayibacter iranicus TaxID=59737 RepID=A0AAD1EMX8_9MICO|nr:decaprenyl-phosphate phosphoribosyltransferase [Rathayibacter iranicus]AZZ56637.1 decaprenyl-phosphate phosphoribosyltransferase [Rathayibacter iranicus]MWV31330.1 decaprenyl-phosphate phosphoribosyltransferase [Rathayibacter iranicus NCPPB 2253 = VKM Ac-1602]PPI43282.1 decaprenyl-phosphate phosphoribosyltransferase [Rathayibacter iranicus]PPI58225.1 decaprenyl-phosphate phosphoribosyltransferase [Rathayibacter iranicus]PPI69438.1 decaprenyl-phosphate phosphoribosyltransferase [Rathayibacte
MNTARALVAAMRPRQWLKNVLVLAAPVASARVFEPEILAASLIAVVAFSLASSGGYLLNDLLDVESDRLHPKKRFRPIASGALPLRAAWVAAVVLMLAPVLVTFVAGFTWFAATLAGYLVMQIAYCIWLKEEPVIDILIVAGGFVLRAISGAAVADIPLTQWFLLAVSSGSLFMVAGKRYSEKLQSEGRENAHTRATLKIYTQGYLRFVWSVAASLTMISYALWALFINGENSLVSIASVVPFGAALFLYALDIERGRAAAPEELVLGDLRLLICGALWAVLFVVAIVTRTPVV